MDVHKSLLWTSINNTYGLSVESIKTSLACLQIKIITAYLVIHIIYKKLFDCVFSSKLVEKEKERERERINACLINLFNPPIVVIVPI